MDEPFNWEDEIAFETKAGFGSGPNDLHYGFAAGVDWARERITARLRELIRRHGEEISAEQLLLELTE